MMRKHDFKASSLLFAAAAVGVSSIVSAQSITTFTPGDVVVMRTGDSTNPDNTTSVTTQVAVYLDEYTPNFSQLVGTLAVPSTGSSALTLPGSDDFQHEGVLSFSTNGQFVSFAGYNASVGAVDANKGTTAATDVQKVIGVVGTSASTLNTSTPVGSYGVGSTTSSAPYIRGAFSNDGSEFYTFGKYAGSGATSNGGLAYISGTGSTATTTTVEGFGDTRDAIVANGQLYVGAGSSSYGTHGAFQVSGGQPTTNLGSSQTNNVLLTNDSGGLSASALAFINVPIPAADTAATSQNGEDVLYTIGDQGTPGIAKYFYNASDGTLSAANSNPSALGSPTGGARGDTGAWDNTEPGDVDVALNALSNVFDPVGLVASSDPTNSDWIDLTVTGSNGIYTYIDKSGDPEAPIPADAFAEPVSAPAGEVFRGAALAPGSPVPEPTSLSLIGLASVGLLGRRKRNVGL